MRHEINYATADSRLQPTYATTGGLAVRGRERNASSANKSGDLFKKKSMCHLLIYTSGSTLASANVSRTSHCEEM